MQPMFSALKQAIRKSILVLGLISLLSFPGLFMTQPIAATPNQKLIQQDKMEKESQVANQREQEYEEQIKAAKDPEKVYEENLKEERKANPGEGIVQKTVEGAEKIVDKVTGNN